MKASDPRYHVGLGLILEQHGDEFSFDRSASLADLWRILFHNLLHHPIKTTFLSRRYMHGTWSRPPKGGGSE